MSKKNSEITKKTTGLWTEFKKFISRGNVVDMAVGVAVATAFTAIVTAFTKGFVSPMIALITGNVDLSEMKWILREAVLDAEGAVVTSEIAILWGAFIQAIINFLIIALVMFIFLKIVTSAAKRAAKLREEMTDRLTGNDVEKAKAEAEAKAKAEAEEKAAAEAKAAQEAEIAAEKERKLKEFELLSEIRDLLKEKNNG